MLMYNSLSTSFFYLIKNRAVDTRAAFWAVIDLFMGNLSKKLTILPVLTLSIKLDFLLTTLVFKSGYVRVLLSEIMLFS